VQYSQNKAVFDFDGKNIKKKQDQFWLQWSRLVGN